MTPDTPSVASRPIPSLVRVISRFVSLRKSWAASRSKPAGMSKRRGGKAGAALKASQVGRERGGWSGAAAISGSRWRYTRPRFRWPASGRLPAMNNSIASADQASGDARYNSSSYPLVGAPNGCRAPVLATGRQQFCAPLRPPGDAANFDPVKNQIKAGGYALSRIHCNSFAVVWSGNDGGPLWWPFGLLKAATGLPAVVKKALRLLQKYAGHSISDLFEDLLVDIDLHH